MNVYLKSIKKHIESKVAETNQKLGEARGALKAYEDIQKALADTCPVCGYFSEWSSDSLRAHLEQIYSGLQKYQGEYQNKFYAHKELIEQYRVDQSTEE